jgi:hypothetical protein
VSYGVFIPGTSFSVSYFLGFFTQTSSSSRSLAVGTGVCSQGSTVGFASNSLTGDSDGGSRDLLSLREGVEEVAGGASSVALARAKASFLAFSKSDYCLSSSRTRRASFSFCFWRALSFSSWRRA